MRFTADLRLACIVDRLSSTRFNISTTRRNDIRHIILFRNSCRGASNQGKTDFPVGAEGCGIVVATGPNVTSVRPGDAVSCSLARYNDYSVFSERMLCKVPEASAEVAAVALSGLFGSMVVQSAADIKPGQTVFVTAGAGRTSSFRACPGT